MKTLVCWMCARGALSTSKQSNTNTKQKKRKRKKKRFWLARSMCMHIIRLRLLHAQTITGKREGCRVTHPQPSNRRKGAWPHFRAFRCEKFGFRLHFVRNTCLVIILAAIKQQCHSPSLNIIELLVCTDWLPYIHVCCGILWASAVACFLLWPAA